MATKKARQILRGFAIYLAIIPSGLATLVLLISRHADDGGGLSDLRDIDDLEMIMQQVQAEQEQEEEAEQVRH
ncbi:hypothetical protein Tco_0707445 [Tanacetum coccineum]|uniref:Uncharacterized protein n=1 Tax=Tanacetum coccineum TaxID=301880 RepID=A0ABQ4YA99_9ASTR